MNSIKGIGLADIIMSLNLKYIKGSVLILSYSLPTMKLPDLGGFLKIGRRFLRC
jgi:hypothetical protein